MDFGTSEMMMQSAETRNKETEINFFEQGILRLLPFQDSMKNLDALEGEGSRSHHNTLEVPVHGQVRGEFQFEFRAPEEALSYLVQLEVFKEVANLLVAQELRRWEGVGIHAGMAPPSEGSLSNELLPSRGTRNGKSPQTGQGSELGIGSFVLLGTRDPRLSMEGKMRFQGGKMARARLRVALAMKGNANDRLTR